jgi:hypothetical protein
MPKVPEATVDQVPTPPPEPQIYGLDYSHSYSNPAQAEAQRQSQAAYEQTLAGGSYVRLANGRVVPIRQNLQFRYPGQKVGQMLAQPHLLIKPELRKPDFDYNYRTGQASGKMPRYVWRVRMEHAKDLHRDQETAQYIRAKRMRYVLLDETDENCEFAVFTPYTTTEGDLVTLVSQVLCEILDPQLSYDCYKAWDDLAMHRILDIPNQISTRSTVNNQDGLPVQTFVPGKTATVVDKFAIDTGRT